jgi:hypothetical protein
MEKEPYGDGGEEEIAIGDNKNKNYFFLEYEMQRCT